jgi:thiol-disulfide isomerase/thioredoxin
MALSTNSHSARPHRKLRLAAVLVALVLVAAACGSGGETFVLGSDTDVSAGSVDSDSVGTGVDFDFEDFDGAKVSFSDLPDGPVVLNFFASWCPTCIAEMPDFETVHQNFAGEVNFLGLATQDRIENAIALIEDTGITYDVGNDQNGEVFTQFQGLGMPTTVFIDADGNVTKVHTGVLDVGSLTDTINEELLS